MPHESRSERGEEQHATRRSAEDAYPTEHKSEASYPHTLLRHTNIRRRGSSGTHAQVVLNSQRVHGNRAVQRASDGEGGYSPTLPPFLMGPATLGFDYLLHSLGPGSLPPFRPGQTTVSEMVQGHIAQAQARKAFIEQQQADKHEHEIDNAERAITGLPPDWFLRGEDPPGTLEQPEYENVSPALDEGELQQLDYGREIPIWQNIRG
jgi:hypothetical protein